MHAPRLDRAGTQGVPSSLPPLGAPVGRNRKKSAETARHRRLGSRRCCWSGKSENERKSLWVDNRPKIDGRGPAALPAGIGANEEAGGRARGGGDSRAGHPSLHGVAAPKAGRPG